MKRASRRAPQLVLAAALSAMTIGACGAGAPRAAVRGGASSLRDDVRLAKDRPPLSVVTRDGDARGAISVAVATGGIADERGAATAVALAGLLEARLEAAGIEDASVVAGWDGYRVRVLVGDGPIGTAVAPTSAVIDALRVALLAEVLPSDTRVLAWAQRKLDALATRPMADPALLDAARCTGEPFAVPSVPKAATPTRAPLSAGELDAWRRAAHGLGRVAFASVGPAGLGDAAAQAIARGAIWPVAASVVPSPWPAVDAPAEIYDASGTIAAGSARVTLAAHTTSPAQAMSPAYALGDPRGPLASRLAALDAPGKVDSVTATAHPTEGCVAVTFDLAARDLATDASGRIATAVALARQELAVEIAASEGNAALVLALGAGDPREAAERAAWWALASNRPGAGELRFSVAIGVAGGRGDAPAGGTGTLVASRVDAIRSDLDRATVAWRAPVVEARARVERGQGELWLLLASTCGAMTEVDDDAGASAAVAVAVSEEARRALAGRETDVEPWVSDDGIGLVVHGPAGPGESPSAHASRLADLAARAFAADALDPSLVARARATLLGRATEPGGLLLSTLASAITPGHTSWFAPLGTAFGLGHSSDSSVLLRASALRAGPLRVAVVANADAAQSQVAVRAVDRWVARRPGEVRACPAASTAVPARPGTYAVEGANAGSSEAWLAFPLAKETDASSRVSAAWIAAALDGEDGLLAHALGAASLAREWSVRVLGRSGNAALVIRIVAMEGTLDAAVAQARALLERLRQGALSPADYARAAAVRDDEDLRNELDPRARLIALWRGSPPKGEAPSIEMVRAFAAKTLHDDALVIAAARPPRSHASLARTPGAP